jgi:hypothetical protein
MLGGLEVGYARHDRECRRGGGRSSRYKYTRCNFWFGYFFPSDRHRHLSKNVILKFYVYVDYQSSSSGYWFHFIRIFYHEGYERKS